MPFILGKTVSEIFLERVRVTPKLVGFQFKQAGSWHPVTYRRFRDECRLASFGLMGLGAKPGDRIAIFSNTRFEWALCDMAILGAAGVSVPIYASNTASDAEYVLNHSESKIAIVEG